jgi:hypothetical protein
VGLSTAHQSAYGGGGIPHAYLIGPDGVVVWEGHPSELQDGRIEDACRKTRDFYARKVASELKPAASAFEKGKLSEAKALAEAAKAKGAGNREVEADADYLVLRVGEMVAFWKRTIDGATEAGRYGDVFDTLAKIRKHYPDSEEATAAEAKEKELKADPLVQREMDAWKKLEKIESDIQRAEGDEKKLKGITKKLESFVEKYPSAKAAKRAQQLLAAIAK